MKKNIKGIRPEIIAVAAIFLLGCLFMAGKSAMNIISALSYDKKETSVPVNSIESNQVYVQTPQDVQQELLTENPVKKVRAIIDNSAQINDDNRWYKVGDIVEGQAKIVAVEPSRILVEWNGIQGYVPLDYSVTAAAQSQPQQFGGQFNNLTEEQKVRIQQGLQALSNLTEEQKARITQGLQGLQSLGQIWQNMAPQYQVQTRARLEELGQRIQNMPQDERQNAIQQLGQQWQQWLQTDQSQLPNFSLE
jgi:hypothetical protein